MALSISATSPTFTITSAPTVTIDSPNSGSYAYTSSIVVQFTKTNFTTGVDLYHTSGTTFNTSNNIAINFTGTQFTWSIPDSLSGTNIYIWVRKTADSSIIDRTNSAISITSTTQTKTASEVSDFTESVTDSKTAYKTSFSTSDISDFTESTTSGKLTWKHIKAATDSSQFSTDSVTDSKRTWKHIKPTSDVSDFSESTTDDKRTWKHIKAAIDSTHFPVDTPTYSLAKWKQIIVQTSDFSESVTHDIVKWKQIIGEISDFIETVSYYKTIGVPSANESSQFIEDVTTAITKRCHVRQFTSSPTESYSTSYKTGWIKASKDLDKNTLIRRLGVEYHSTDPITLKIYIDGDLVNPVFTNTLAAATAKETTNKSLRVGQRARLFMLEMVTAASTNSNTKIEDIEVLTDG